MRFYKNIADGYLESMSTGYGQIEITEAEYNSILSIIRSAPIAPDGYTYLLRADLEWELVENHPDSQPQDDDIDNAEAFDIIFGGAE